MAAMSDWLSEARRGIELAGRKVYLDNAGAGPLPRQSVEAMMGFLRVWEVEGEPWELLLSHVEELRRSYSSMIGARPGEVAIVPSASYGLGQALLGLDYERGSNIVVGGNNFPSSIYAAHALRGRGLVSEVRIARARGACIDYGEYERLVDDLTVAIVADYVAWLTGCVEDLKALRELADRHGAVLVSDIFHAVGVIPVDVKSLGVDIAVAGSYKWLLGPHGVGFLYVDERLLSDLKPASSGWLAVKDSVLKRFLSGEKPFERPLDTSRLELPGDATMFEWGTWASVSVEGVLESIEFLRRLDAPGRFETHTSRIAGMIQEGLEELGFEVITPRDRRAAIVSFKARDSYRIAESLYKKGIVVSARPGLVRISPHFYNTREEAQTLLEALGHIKKSEA